MKNERVTIQIWVSAEVRQMFRTACVARGTDMTAELVDFMERYSEEYLQELMTSVRKKTDDTVIL